MNRTFELLNKTNHCGTNAERHTLQHCHELFAAGLALDVMHTEDRFTQHGLIGAAWVHRNCVEHLVMIRRALGAPFPIPSHVRLTVVPRH